MSGLQPNGQPMPGSANVQAPQTNSITNNLSNSFNPSTPIVGLDPKRPWNDIDDARLAQLVMKEGDDTDWGQVGSNLNRDSADCGVRWFRHLQQKHNSNGTANPQATASSQAALGFAPPPPGGIQTFNTSTNGPSGTASAGSSNISAAVPRSSTGPTGDSPTQASRKWAPEEEDRLDQAHALYGLNWDPIARFVGGGRTPRACKDRWARRSKSKNEPETSGDLAATRFSARRASVVNHQDSNESENTISGGTAAASNGQPPADPTAAPAETTASSTSESAAFDRRPSPFADSGEEDTPAAPLTRVRTPSPPPKIIGKKLGKNPRAPPVVGEPTASSSTSTSAAPATPSNVAAGASGSDGDGSKGTPQRNEHFLAMGDMVPNPPVPFQKHAIIRGRRTKAATEMEGKLLSKTGKVKKVHICPAQNCDAAFKRSEHLKRHYKAVHIGAKPFPCDAEGCDKTFSRKDNLHQHMIFVHSLKPVRDEIQYKDDANFEGSDSNATPGPAPADGSDATPDASGSQPAPSVLQSSANAALAPADGDAVAVDRRVRYEPIAEEDKNRRRRSAKHEPAAAAGSLPPGVDTVASGSNTRDLDEIDDDQDAIGEVDDQAEFPLAAPVTSAPAPVVSAAPVAASAEDHGARTLAGSRLKSGLGARFRQGRGGISSAATVPHVQDATASGINTDADSGFAPPRKSPKLTASALPDEASNKRAREDETEDEATLAKKVKESESGELPTPAQVA